MSNTPRTGPVHRERWPEVREAVQESVVLGVACLITYLLATDILSHVYFLSHDDEVLGGLWAVIATVFVLRGSYEQSVTAALSRVMATLVSFALCLIYLAFLPFHPWALAVLVGASALAATADRPAGRRGHRRYHHDGGPRGRGREPSARLAAAHPAAGRHGHRRRGRRRGGTGSSCAWQLVRARNTRRRSSTASEHHRQAG